MARGLYWALLALYALGLTTPVCASIAFVQVADQNPASASTVSVTYPSAQTAGDLNVVVIGWDNISSIQSVSDTNGNTYIPAVGPVTSSSGNAAQLIYYAKNVAGGANTVTVTFSATISWPDVRVVEYSGIDTASPFDAGSSGSGVGTAMNSGSLTTTSANDLLVASDYVSDVTTAAGSGYTQRIYTEGGEIVEDQVVSAVGSYSATATQGTSAWWLMQLAAFRAAGSGSGGDTQAPTAPTALTASATSGSQITLSWTASTDNVGVTGYFVERCQGVSCSSFAQVGTPTSATFADSGLATSTAYSYRVRATDAAGNLSSYSNTTGATTTSGTIAFVQVADQNPQSASTVTVTYPSAQTAGDLNVVIIGWDNVASIQSVSDTRGNTYVPAVGPVTSSGNAAQLIYYAKNVATGANTVTVTFSATSSWPDVRVVEYSGIDTANPFDGGSSASGVGTALSSGSLTTTNANDLLVASDYVADVTTAVGPGYTQRIYTEGGEIVADREAATTGSYSATATQGTSGWWLMQLAAFRAAGSGGGADTTPPTAPTGLTATAASGSQINLSWTASTDNVGVTGYLVERCQGSGCTNFSQIATSTGTSFNDTGLSAATSYSYRVRATDAASNLSSYSSAASATTQSGGGGGGDTTPPSAPGGLTATPASSAQIRLSWTASSDDVGVTGYLVERCSGTNCTTFAQIGTPTPSSYIDSGLTASTAYSYRVRATDAAGNLSSYSSVVSATTSPGGICD